MPIYCKEESLFTFLLPFWGHMRLRSSGFYRPIRINLRIQLETITSPPTAATTKTLPPSYTQNHLVHVSGECVCVLSAYLWIYVLHFPHTMHFSAVLELDTHASINKYSGSYGIISLLTHEKIKRQFHLFIY